MFDLVLIYTHRYILNILFINTHFGFQSRGRLIKKSVLCDYKIKICILICSLYTGKGKGKRLTFGRMVGNQTDIWLIQTTGNRMG